LSLYLFFPPGKGVRNETRFFLRLRRGESFEKHFKIVPSVIVFIHELFGLVAVQRYFVGELPEALLPNFPYQLRTIGGNALKRIFRVFPKMTEQPFRYRGITTTFPFLEVNTATLENPRGRFISFVSLRDIFRPY